MAKTLVLVLGRLGFGLWLAFVGLFAMASLIGHPGPFILMAFVVGGLPAWVMIRRHEYRLIAAAVIGVTVTAVPVLMLVGYGVDEGGVSTAGAVPLALTLAVIAGTLAWFGMMLGRLVWLPWK
jgi:hypothetical protein